MKCSEGMQMYTNCVTDIETKVITARIATALHPSGTSSGVGSDDDCEVCRCWWWLDENYFIVLFIFVIAN